VGVALADTADAILMGEMVWHGFHRDQVGLFAELAGGLDHLRQAARRVQYQFVRQHDRKGFIAHDIARAPHRVAEAERRLLPRKTHCAGFGLVARQDFLLGLLPARSERRVEFEHPVEMVLDHALVAAGDEDEMLDAGLLGLIDHIWINGLSTIVSISFGIALVAGRTRVPRPATGKTALRIFMGCRRP
jgi:hypothetical protein